MIPYTIVISRSDRLSHLTAALDALAEQSGKNRFEAIVTDTVGDDDTVEWLRDLAAPFPLRHLIVHDHPRTTDLRNRALRHVRGRYVVFCTACFVARPHFLTSLESYHAASPDAVLTTHDCFVVPKRALRRVGGFDDALQGTPLSIWELLYRLQKEGFPWVPVEKSVGDLTGRTDTPVNERHLRHLYKKHGCKDFGLTLMAVIPPWVDVGAYRNTLHSYFACRNGTADQQAAARALQRACKMAAHQYLG